LSKKKTIYRIHTEIDILKNLEKWVYFFVQKLNIGLNRKMHLITILGQTSSGKSELAVKVAQKFGNSCIVNCDSRQVYKGLNIGTGKVEGQWKDDIFVYKDVDHFLIDYTNPEQEFSLIKYIDDFFELINRIKNKYQTIILTGGTGLYAKAIIEEINYGKIKPEFVEVFEDLKKKLQLQNLKELQSQLDQTGFNNSDWNNKVRLVSQLIRKEAKKNNWFEPTKYYKFESKNNFVIEIDQMELKTKIKNRLLDRLNQGIIEETQAFLDLGWDRINQLGLEYRLSWFYLHGFINKEELQHKLIQENLQYAKRQLTWLKKQKNFVWIKPDEDLVH
jgi:tRNA dimethylallyltransferase